MMKFTWIAAVMVALTASAAAQPGMMGSGMMMGPGMMRGPGMNGPQGFAGMCDPRGAGLAAWRVEAIERAVKLTDAQKSALAKVRDASVKAAQVVRDACPDEIPATSSARMALMEKRAEAMLQAVKIVRPEFDAFYASLDDEQKAKVDSAGPRGWGWRHWRWNDQN